MLGAQEGGTAEAGAQTQTAATCDIISCRENWYTVASYSLVSKMDATRKLFLLSVLLFAVCGLGATVGNAEVVEDFKAPHTRVDAEQDPFTSVTLTPPEGGPQSTLFKSCLAETQTLDAKFASIETTLGAEYIRYVPDLSMSPPLPLPWEMPEGDVSNIFECSEAAAEGGWLMFKYDGNDCQVVNMSYDLSLTPECNEEESEAVFILSTGNPECWIPSFYIGVKPYSSYSTTVCMFVNESPMTHDNAESFCSSYREDDFMMMYTNEFDPDISYDMVVAKLQEYNYGANLFVSAHRYGLTSWSGYFSSEHWVGGAKPGEEDTTSEVAYLDSDAGWKLRGAPLSFEAGVVCITSLELG